MFRLFRKLKYGDTNKTPKYIEKKNKWLYKNIWYTYNKLCKKLGLDNVTVEYSYEVKGKDGYYDLYVTEDFNYIIQKLLEDPFRIRFPHPEEFDKRQNKIITTILYKSVKDYNDRVMKKIGDFQDKVFKK